MSHRRKQTDNLETLESLIFLSLMKFLTFLLFFHGCVLSLQLYQFPILLAFMQFSLKPRPFHSLVFSYIFPWGMDRSIWKCIFPAFYFYFYFLNTGKGKINTCYFTAAHNKILHFFSKINIQTLTNYVLMYQLMRRKLQSVVIDTGTTNKVFIGAVLKSAEAGWKGYEKL